MPIQFKMVAKRNNLVQPPEVNYYPCAVNQGEETLETLAQKICAASSLTEADCFGVMYALSNAISEALTDGKIVRIDSLGTFQLTLKATGSPEPTVRGKSLIKENKIVFKPSKRLKAKVAKATYEQLK